MASSNRNRRSAAKPAPQPSVGPSAERATPAGPPAEHTTLAQAQRNFKRGLAHAAQLQLAHEVAMSQGPTLVGAYTNLLSVGSGYRTRRSGDTGTPALLREPCVSFLVRRKWPTAGRPGHPQALPRHLLVFADVGGQRLLCAVPTDVRPRSDHGKPVPHDGAVILPFGIFVDQAQSHDFVTGVVTCAVRRPAAPGTTYVLSCRHVLSRTEQDIDPDQVQLPVLLGDEHRTPLGQSTSVRGPLDEQPEAGFDAQLAVVQQPAALRAALGGLAFDSATSYVHGPDEVGDGFYVATGRRGADNRRLLVWVSYHNTVRDFKMVYTRRDGSGVTVRHDLVLFGMASDVLSYGDSGSPAVMQRRGRQLVGMYIGGADGRAFVIPAWQLMSPANYGLPAEAQWALAPAGLAG